MIEHINKSPLNSLSNIPPQFKANYVVMFCAIWYHLYNLKNMKKNYEGISLLVEFQTKSQ